MNALTIKALGITVGLTIASLHVNVAHADGSHRFKMRFAGGFVQNLQQADVFMGAPTGNVDGRSVALVKGRGTFGRADIIAVTVDGPPVSDTPCSDGLIKIADITENNLVLTFSDLSLLFGNGTGVVCLNPADPTGFPLAEIEGTWDGGTGRFKRVGGKWSIRFHFAEPVGPGDDSPDTQFVAETGVIKGRITGLKNGD